MNSDEHPFAASQEPQSSNFAFADTFPKLDLLETRLSIRLTAELEDSRQLCSKLLAAFVY